MICYKKFFKQESKGKNVKSIFDQNFITIIGIVW